MSLRNHKEENKKGFDPVSPGTHIARCWRMVELGQQEKFYDGQSQGYKPMLHIAFEIYDEPRVYDEAKGEEPAILGSKFTISLHEKSKLRRTLQSWRGADYTDAEISAGVDFTKVVGAPCMVNVVNKELEGRKIGFIDSIVPIPKGVQVPDQHNSSAIYEIDQMLADYKANGHLDNYQMPDFMKRDIIEGSKEFAGAIPGVAPTPTSAPASQPTTDQAPPF